MHASPANEAALAEIAAGAAGNGFDATFRKLVEVGASPADVRSNPAFTTIMNDEVFRRADLWMEWLSSLSGQKAPFESAIQRHIELCNEACTAQFLLAWKACDEAAPKEAFLLATASTLQATNDICAASSSVAGFTAPMALRDAKSAVKKHYFVDPSPCGDKMKEWFKARGARHSTVILQWVESVLKDVSQKKAAWESIKKNLPSEKWCLLSDPVITKMIIESICEASGKSFDSMEFRFRVALEPKTVRRILRICMPSMLDLDIFADICRLPLHREVGQGPTPNETVLLASLERCPPMMDFVRLGPDTYRWHKADFKLVASKTGVMCEYGKRVLSIPEFLIEIGTTGVKNSYSVAKYAGLQDGKKVPSIIDKSAAKRASLKKREKPAEEGGEATGSPAKKLSREEAQAQHEKEQAKIEARQKAAQEAMQKAAGDDPMED